LKENPESMKRKNIFGSLALLLGCLMASYAVPSPVTSTTAIKPDQPYMQEALRDLENARRELQQAARNKGGHRMTAMNLINRAIAEVNRGINFDRRHDAHARRAAAADQPNMRAALEHLKSAQKNLQRATADKGGHRANALNLVAQAIAEVNRGIDAAK
jgi:hypothetical protein